MKILKYIVLVVTMAVITGCASTYKRDNGLKDRNSEIVASDFVMALSSLRGHMPTNTMLQLRSPRTEFGSSLKNELRNAGYGIQSIADDDTGPMLVTYEADSFQNTTYESVAYRVRVGSVELGREYEIRAGNVFPVTSLSVKGVAISSEPLDQSMFERTTVEESFEQNRWREIAPRNQQQPAPVIISSAPRIETIVQSNPQLLLESSKSELETTTPDVNKELVRPRRLENMLMLGESNYVDIFKKYEIVKSDVIIFPNDSLRLGESGKTKVAKFLSGFDETKDILSVIGCSHGKSNISDGNRQLALGRAQRVIDELLGHRILASKLYDEGCWAGVGQKELPARGVILTQRRASGPA